MQRHFKYLLYIHRCCVGTFENNNNVKHKSFECDPASTFSVSDRICVTVQAVFW